MLVLLSGRAGAIALKLVIGANADQEHQVLAEVVCDKLCSSMLPVDVCYSSSEVVADTSIAQRRARMRSKGSVAQVHIAFPDSHT